MQLCGGAECEQHWMESLPELRLDHMKFTRSLALLALVSNSLHAQATTTGAFITRLGTDTVAVERYQRTGDKLVGDLLMRNPRARVMHYVADLDRNGRIKGMTVSVRRVGGDTTAPPVTSITTLLGDTIATIDVARSGLPDTSATGKKPFHGTGVPQVNFAPASYAVYEQMLIASKLGRDSVGYVVLAPGRGAAPSIWLSRHGRDSVLFASTAFEGWNEVARVDAQNRILGVNSTATTVKTIATRADRVDIDAIGKAWAAAEVARGGQIGAMSPADTVRSTIGAAKIEVAYSRPYKRGRVIFGSEVVPWNKVWRTGANAATQFTTTSDLMFGNTLVPAGKYTLWTLPTPAGAKLIINSQTGQWGTDYDASKDFTRLDLQTKTLTAPVDQFTIAVGPQGTGGVLRLSWDTTEYSIPFTIK
jgi:hypothetical protein